MVRKFRSFFCTRPMTNNRPVWSRYKVIQ
jgi:hypothetical protein